MSGPSSKKILIVDDEPDACASLRRILQLDDYEVDIAGSVQQMLQPRDWDRYFAILLDRKLPDGNIEELFPRIKSLAPAAAIVVITGFADLESSIEALRHGVEDYIIKPINIDALRATLVRVHRIRQAEQRARQAERLAAIGEVVASMAHESRNFLQRIRSAADLLEQLGNDNEDALEEIVRIKEAERGLENLLEELREFAAPIRLRRERCSLQEIWRSAWSDARSAGCGVDQSQLNEDVGSSDVTCSVDAFRIGQVFRNLFENSLAACGNNANIDVHCQAVNGHDVLQIVVRDNGPGLSDEQKSQVFRPFFTTKSRGTGLGMAIVKRIVEAHGGAISVGSCQGPGAEFLINLPAHPG